MEKATTSLRNTAMENEYKGWINLDDKRARAKVARHLAALANHGGGHLIFGFDDNSLKPQQQCPPSLDKYNRDTFTSIVEHYLEPVFQCEVLFGKNEADDRFPVVRVPGHGRVPVIAKAGGPQDDKGRPEGIVARTYYIRKPGPKSEEIVNAQEWGDLIRRCVLNDRSNLLSDIASLFQNTQDTVLGGMEQLDLWFEEREKRFLDLLSKSQASDNWTVPFQDNRYHLSYAILSDDERFSPKEFLQILREVSNETRNTVWKGWSMFYPFSDSVNRPRPYPEGKDGSGATVLETNFMDHNVPELWCVAPDGRVSLIRAYVEDRLYTSGSLGRTPGTWISPERVIQETAELVTHARAWAKRFKTAKQVIFRCAWTGLENRELAEFEPRGELFRSHKSNSKKRVARRVCTLVELEAKWSTVVSGLSSPILELFGFDYCNPDYVENIKPNFLSANIPNEFG